MTPQERRARAFRIQAMMEDGEINAAFDEVKAEFVAEWQRTFDAGERENLWRAVRVLELVRQRMASWGAADGSMSAIKRIR